MSMHASDDEQVSRDDLLDNLAEVQEKLDDDVERAENIQDLYSRQDDSFQESADNHDGNEDRPDTFSEDNENVQGCDRGEELVRLGSFLERASQNVQSRIDSVTQQVERAETPEQLLKAQQEVDELSKDYEDVRGIVDDV
jgi:hypothetical protein